MTGDGDCDSGHPDTDTGDPDTDTGDRDTRDTRDSGDRETAQWPVDLRGITESVVTTPGPDDRWNVAALGLHAGSPVTARTWGRTRTRRNFSARGEGYVQFTRDPVDFVEAALGVFETDDPMLESADAWVRVSVERVDSDDGDAIDWVEWALRPEETGVERRVVPATNRGYNAVVEATVAASRLDVDAYDRSALERRLEWLADVVETCGGRPERDALALVREYADW